MLSISQNVRRSVRVFARLFVRLFICVFTFEAPFKRLFAPTSQSQMSNIFRDAESLGKSLWKEVVSDLNIFFENCLKLPREKKIVFLQNIVETTLPDG